MASTQEPEHNQLELYCHGVNHAVAPVEVRERLRSVHQDAAGGGASRFRQALTAIGVREYALLSTCNRIEIYTVGGAGGTGGTGDDDISAALPELLRSLHVDTPASVSAGFVSAGFASADFSERLYRHRDLDAVVHLARVACGVDSMVLGETQIQGQVAECLTRATERGTIGPVLTETFRTALNCGKRARGETCIGCSPSSISAAAVQVAQDTWGDLADRRVLILGAGEMGGLAVKAFSYRGCTEIDLVSRTLARARATARHSTARPYQLDALESLLSTADILFTSTASETPLLTRPLLERVMQRREHRELLILDIAVPRDVTPEAGDLPGVNLVDIDALRDVVDQGLEERRREIPAVETIIEQELRRFPRHLRERMVRPAVAQLRRWAEAVRREELQSFFDDEETRKAVDRFSRKLVHRVLSPPMERLRDPNTPGFGLPEAAALRDLFSLDEPSS